MKKSLAVALGIGLLISQGSKAENDFGSIVYNLPIYSTLEEGVRPIQIGVELGVRYGDNCYSIVNRVHNDWQNYLQFEKGMDFEVKERAVVMLSKRNVSSIEINNNCISNKELNKLKGIFVNN